MSIELKQIPVIDLRVGMYVAKLDRDWLETPFLMQGFYIESASDIDVVTRYCKHVWIDFSRCPNLADYPEKDPTASGSQGRYSNQGTFAQEFRRSAPVFKRARALTKSLLEEIQFSGGIDSQNVNETVNDCVQSVIRHPDALTWMSKIRDESEYTADHCLNVCILAIAFGRNLNLPENELHKLGLCGLLHDVGKMQTPADILNNPGVLTAQEMDIMRSHTVHGRNLLLKSADVYSGAIDVAFSHHERADGMGYPRNLAGNGISKYARIISIVDAYDAMTADRCYQKARTTSEALKIIYKERGKQFDEKLAFKFLETVGLYPVGSIVELSNGIVGIVIETNKKYRQLPRVIALRDENKQKLEKPRIIDLSFTVSGELASEYLIKQVLKDKDYGVSVRDYQDTGWLNYGKL